MSSPEPAAKDSSAEDASIEALALEIDDVHISPGLEPPHPLMDLSIDETPAEEIACEQGTCPHDSVRH